MEVVSTCVVSTWQFLAIESLPRVILKVPPSRHKRRAPDRRKEEANSKQSLLWNNKTNHSAIQASVAQWQSICLRNRRLRVRVPSGVTFCSFLLFASPRFHYNYFNHRSRYLARPEVLAEQTINFHAITLFHSYVAFSSKHFYFSKTDELIHRVVSKQKLYVASLISLPFNNLPSLPFSLPHRPKQIDQPHILQTYYHRRLSPSLLLEPALSILR